jgi:hypothetical protein
MACTSRSVPLLVKSGSEKKPEKRSSAPASASPPQSK